ncbi:MAG TPA: hypothetical protein IAC75_00100 [Candidatus Spyradosoma merdigallinarum]|uniref:Uncharacterized protein n=1 Tax=Candidatus Spyradosoma merdigallinarum TaxID=2840950 RepID=A0A9D1NJ08_9BACT|nr:hypothetical protein [Candidatus Spyradosoma merdigallinarum]
MEEKGRRGTRTRPRERVLAPAAAALFCAAAGTAAALLVPVAPRVSNGNAEKAQESSASATLLSPESLGVGASVPASKKRGGGEKAALPVPAGSVRLESRREGDSDAIVYLENGDIYGRYGGGREYLPDDAVAAERDNRLWIDARVPLEFSPRAKFYFVSTLTLGDEVLAPESLSDYARYYGVGGGFGFSFLLSPDAELNFDVRRTRTMESATEDRDPQTDSAGISIKVKF